MKKEWEKFFDEYGEQYFKITQFNIDWNISVEKVYQIFKARLIDEIYKKIEKANKDLIRELIND